MSDPFKDRRFPRAALIGAAMLVGFAMAAAIAGRFANVGTLKEPTAAALESRDLRFEDRGDGAVLVYDVDSSRQVAVLAPGTNVFVRGALRGLARARRMEDVGPEPAFRLTHWGDGRLTIADPTTNRQIDLGAFGITNARAFAVLLTAPERMP
jgi:putative photosynthetic complex assembly protein